MGRVGGGVQEWAEEGVFRNGQGRGCSGMGGVQEWGGASGMGRGGHQEWAGGGHQEWAGGVQE